MPIYDLRSALHRRPLAALFRLGRVGLATPLRGGSSLMAREFVAAQDPRDPGVLVLSRDSGAAALLDEAVAVDPMDTVGFAQALRAALRMPLDERQDRWRRMMVKLLHHDAARWHDEFLAALAAAHRAAVQARVGQESQASPTPVSGAALRAPRHGIG